MTRQLLCVIPYCVKDVDLTRKLLGWIARISPKLAPHACLLAADSAVPHETKVEFNTLAKSIFDFAETAIIAVPSDEVGWPKAANAMFRIASLHIESCFQLPWLWLEPDCVPMRASWLDEIALSYSRCPKKFMGALIQSSQPPMPPVHLAGCAVYPPDTGKLMAEFCAPASTLAFDIGSAGFTVPRSMNTPLIHHHYGTMELAPTFKAAREPGDAVNVVTLDFVRKEAALFHRTKNGGLIDLLREKADSAQTRPASAPSAAPEAQGKRSPGRPRKSEPVSSAPAPVPA